jgi:hypothetical protein
MKIQRIFLIASLFLGLESVVFSISTTCKQNDTNQIIFEMSGILKNKPYDAIFSVQSTGTQKKIALNRQEKFVYTTAKTFFDSSKKQMVDLVIPNYFGTNENYSYKCEFKPSQMVVKTGSLMVKTNATQDKQSDQINQSQKIGMDRRKLEKYADQQARTVANRIVKSYGSQENYKYNFVKGLNSGYISSKIFNKSSTLYSSGFQDGVNKGISDGERMGRDAAYKESRNTAKQVARDRHKAAVHKGGYVDYSAPRINTAFDAHKITNQIYDIERNLNDKIRIIDSDLIVELKSQRFGSDYQIHFIYDDRFSISNWIKYNGKYNYVESYFSDEHAFNEWKRNGFGGPYDFHLYEKMSSYEKRSFESEFKRVYKNVINEKLEAAIKEDNSVAYTRGIFWGAKLGNEESYLNGYKSGIENSLLEHAYRAFNDAYSACFEQDFYEAMREIDEKVVLDLHAEVRPSPKEAGSFDVVLYVENYGGASSFESIVSMTSSAFRQKNISKIPSITDKSSNTYTFQDVLVINNDILADKSYTIEFEIEDQKIQVTMNLGFPYFLSQWPMAKDSQTKLIIKESILKSILKEWDENHGTFAEDIYAQSLPSRSFLGILVDQALTNDPSLRTLHKDIHNLDRSGSWIHFNKNSSFMKILNKIE